MKFKIDQKKILTMAREQLSQRVTELVALQYCPVHGEFAEVTHLQVDEEGGRMHVEFSSCCDALRATVHQALGSSQKDEHA